MHVTVQYLKWGSPITKKKKKKKSQNINLLDY